MKKLLFLISLCLLSQNFTIASESTGNTVPASVPVPMQPVKEPLPSFSVPIIQAPKILDNAEPVVEKEIKKTVLTGPPVPVSQQELEEQYIETKAEQEKYKI